MSCARACTETVPVAEWTWDGSFAPAHLGFVFWNWPPLSPEFRARIAGLLDGHRVVRVRGKL
ncbi:hypothetical protein ABZ896_20915 [Streptomyces sp. NPDC047072]|uniref:hypothetical protein n=1 Tax=Streptomyces sp. NPDC047072 TaxID=3154809 RepID=UPI0033FE3459